MTDFLLGRKATSRRGEVVTRGPIARDIFRTEIYLPGLEGFKGDGSITEVFIANDINV